MEYNEITSHDKLRIHKLKKKPIGNHTPRNTNSNWSPDIQM
jgi:hypothetical protein